MSLTYPSTVLPFVGVRRSCLRIQSSASATLAAPMPENGRPKYRSLGLLPKNFFHPIEHSKPFASSFALYKPIPFLLDRTVSLLAIFRFLPSDFYRRWKCLVDLPEKEAEAWLARLPFHLIQAVTASEDQRFFFHHGVDLHGIARAVVYYPKGGGGSTITQQLVKKVFLTSERKLSRKFVEGLLSLLVEQRISKWKILYLYLKKMYWGRGVYGIESASQIYFGKSPQSLSMGESALLAGILPGPEFLNPLTNPKRAKSIQAKVLRRMVSAGFLEMETALQIAKEPFYSCSENKVHSPS